MNIRKEKRILIGNKDFLKRERIIRNKRQCKVKRYLFKY